MAYPTPPTDPITEIATDTNYNAPGDDWDATPTKTAPTVAIETQGYVPGDSRPADVDNWLFSMFARWLRYCSDFLDELKLQKVQGPASSTDRAVVIFNGTSGKIGQNSHVTVEDSTGELLYVVPRYRTIRVAGASFHAGSNATDVALAGGSYFGADGPCFSFVLARGAAMLDIGDRLRSGSSIISITVRVNPVTGGGAGTGMRAVLHQTTGDGTDSASSTVDDDGTGATQSLGSFSTLPITVDRGKRIVLVVEGSTVQTGNFSTGDRILYVDIEFDDIGPRNF